GLLNQRRLVMEGAGVLVITDSVSSALVLRSLSGDGTLALGARNLELDQQNPGAFTGSVSTTGGVTHNSATGLTFGPSGGTQTYGTLTAATLDVNVGDVVVTDALHV